MKAAAAACRGAVGLLEGKVASLENMKKKKNCIFVHTLRFRGWQACFSPLAAVKLSTPEEGGLRDVAARKEKILEHTWCLRAEHSYLCSDTVDCLCYWHNIKILSEAPLFFCLVGPKSSPQHVSIMEAYCRVRKYFIPL